MFKSISHNRPTQDGKYVGPAALDGKSIHFDFAKDDNEWKNGL